MSATATRVVAEPALARALAAGMSTAIVGQAVLPAPLAGVAILARSRPGPGGRLSLAAVIQPRQLLSLRRPDLDSALGPAGGRLFSLRPGTLNQVVLSCGTWPLVVPLIGTGARALAVDGEPAVAAALDSFCRALEGVLARLYSLSGKEAPGLEIVLEPRPALVGSVLDAIRRLQNVAGGAVPRRPAPASEYRPAPGAGFDEIGGLSDVKLELLSVCTAFRDPESYRRWGARPARGILLHGPPGTGKTMLARAMAAESGATFLHVRAADVVSRWYGEGERRLQQAFDRARRETPCVLFFDELDGIARDRDGSHEATQRMVTTFLENMDGLESVEGVLVLAATNRLDAVDDALRRPGRFDRVVEVPLPDDDARAEIFRVHIRGAAGRAGRPVIAELDAAALEDAITLSAGMSGAEIAESVRRALEAKIRSGARQGQVTPNELLAAVRSVSAT